MDLFRFIPGYESGIYNQGREPAFIMLLSFIITFSLVRGYTRIARIRGWGSTYIGGIHTHHMVYGLLLAFLAGGLAFAFQPEPGLWQLALAAAFGAGVALVLDEFALIFHLQDVYWEHEGRKSVNAIILGFALGLLFLLRVTPFSGTTDATGLALAGAILLNLLYMLVAALKGKLYSAVFGMFVPALALIAAIRLANPTSPWARRFYVRHPDKMTRAEQRYKAYEKKWRPRQDRLLDFIGGKIGRSG